MEQDKITEIENKKNELKRYKKNVARINKLSERLEILEEKINKIKSPNYSGMPRGGSVVTIDDLLAEKFELEERVTRLKVRGKEIRRNTLAEIDRLEDYRQAEILELYFIDDMSFDDIAEEMGYNNTKSIIRLYSRGINELCNDVNEFSIDE